MMIQTNLTPLENYGNVDFGKLTSSVGTMVALKDFKPLDKRGLDREAQLKLLHEAQHSVGINQVNRARVSNIMPWAWLNEKPVASKDILIYPDQKSSMYGLGIFEGIRGFIKNGVVHLVGLDAHLERLIRGCKESKMWCPSLEEMKKAIVEVVKLNGLPPDNEKGDKIYNIYIRPEIRNAMRGLSPVLAAKDNKPENYDFSVMQLPFDAAYLPEEIKGYISSVERADAKAAKAHIKCTGDYFNASLAKGEAIDHANNIEDDKYKEAIIMNPPNKDGVRTVSEASSANLFIVYERNGENIIRTPGKESNILDGITKNEFINLGRKLGYKVEEGPITEDELLKAKEVFITGTATVLVALTHLAGPNQQEVQIGNGHIGKVSSHLKQAYLAMANGELS